MISIHTLHCPVTWFGGDGIVASVRTGVDASGWLIPVDSCINRSSKTVW